MFWIQSLFILRSSIIASRPDTETKSRILQMKAKLQRMTAPMRPNSVNGNIVQSCCVWNRFPSLVLPIVCVCYAKRVSFTASQSEKCESATDSCVEWDEPLFSLHLKTIFLFYTISNILFHLIVRHESLSLRTERVRSYGYFATF